MIFIQQMPNELLLTADTGWGAVGMACIYITDKHPCPRRLGPSGSLCILTVPSFCYQLIIIYLILNDKNSFQMKKSKTWSIFCFQKPSILKRDASQAENVCEPEKIKGHVYSSENQSPLIFNRVLSFYRNTMPVNEIAALPISPCGSNAYSDSATLIWSVLEPKAAIFYNWQGMWNVMKNTDWLQGL